MSRALIKVVLMMVACKKLGWFLDGYVQLINAAIKFCYCGVTAWQPMNKHFVGRVMQKKVKILQLFLCPRIHTCIKI
jgi:hypothetical protein